MDGVKTITILQRVDMPYSKNTTSTVIIMIAERSARGEVELYSLNMAYSDAAIEYAW